VYKPEQFPEQFRRIREAYETLLRLVELAQFAEPGAGGAVPAAGTPGGEADRLGAELHALWELAVSGGEEPAYRRLKELSERHPGRPDIYLRLYWLLALAPALDPGRGPFDWLVDGVRRAGWSGPVAELVRREVRADPELGLGTGYRTLVDESLRPGLVLAVLEWRWQAAARVGRGEQLPADVEGLRARVRDEGDEAWARLLARAVNYLSWMEDEPSAAAAARYNQEIDTLNHVHARLQEEMDHLEALRELAAGWRRLRMHPQSPAEVVAVVRACWLFDRDLVRPQLWRFLGEVVRAPHEWLDKLDLVRHEGAAILNYLGGVLQQLAEETGTLPELPPPEVLAPRVAEFLLSKGGVGYPGLRGQVLDFCLREAVPPAVVAAFAGSDIGAQLGSTPARAERIRADVPLYFISVAHRVFWM
jgi:hypothetical protein